ncbi:MAG: cytochrome c oxidase assembly protein [Gordonia sp. (in: high G+C Gram-positive bacteria)]
MSLPALTLSTALTQWSVDPLATVAAAAVGGGYLLAARGSRVRLTSRVTFVCGTVLWWLTCNSFVATYADTLFWVRALQVLLLLTIVPFLLAVGRPITALASHPGSRATILRAGRMRWCRVALSATATSLLFLTVPWLLYLTPWYEWVLRDDAVDLLTRLLLVVVGFLYYYSRLQIDPVPRRRHSGVSLLITVGEAVGDGVLGVVLWQGPLIATTYYEALGRGWGPDLRTDQTIGAGVLWIVGDVLGLPLLMLLFRRLRSDDDRQARAEDRAADLIQPTGDDVIPDNAQPWFMNDPQLANRFKHR